MLDRLGRLLGALSAAILYLVLGLGALAFGAVVAVLSPLFLTGLTLYAAGRAARRRAAFADFRELIHRVVTEAKAKSGPGDLWDEVAKNRWEDA